MADINDLLKSKKVQGFLAKKRRPWDNMKAESSTSENGEATTAPIVSETESKHNPTKPVKLDRTGIKRPWQENLKVNSDTLPSVGGDLNPPNSIATESKTNPTLTGSNSKNSSHNSNLKAPEKSDQSRTKVEPISDQCENNEIKVSDLTRTHIEPESNQIIKKDQRLQIGSDIDLNQSRTIIGSESDQTASHVGPVSDQYRTNVGPYKGNKNSVSDIVVSDRSRTGVISVSDQSRTADTYKKDQYRTQVIPGFGSESDHNLIYFLPKLHRRIVSFLVQTCVSRGSRTTPPITYEVLANSVETTVESAKTQVKRLEKKGILIRSQSKMGPSSWTIYEIPLNIYQQVIEVENIERFTNQKKQIEDYVGPSRGPSRGPEGSSSSNIYNNITTITGESDQWNKIVIPDVLTKHGFSVTHAKQVLGDKENKLSFEEVQSSFDNFAIDVLYNKIQVRTTHVAYLMSVLRGQRVQYVSLYAKEQERIQLEDYLTQLKDIEEQNRKQKLQAELALKYKEWMQELTQEEKNKIAKPNEFIEEGSEMQNHLLRAHFNKINGIEV